MIKDLAAYRRTRVVEERRALAEMSVDESIAIGEALLTSSVMADVRPDDHRPLSLARVLSARRDAAARRRR